MTKIIKTDSYTQDKALGLEELLADPSVSTDTGYVYTKDDTTTELYYRSNAGIVKITSGGGLNVPPVDATKLVNSPYEVELSNTDGGLTFRDTVAPTETLGILKLSSNALKNTQFGYAAGETLTTGTGNTIIGYGAGTDLATDSSSNVIIGSSAVETSAVAVDQMVAIGFEAAKANTADGTVAIGYQAGLANTYGIHSTYIGYKAGAANINSDATIIGHNALYKNNAMESVIIGSQCAANQTGGTTGYDVAIGYQALNGAGAASYNVAIGHSAMTNATSASANVAIGNYAGQSITTQSGNVIIGYQCGINSTGTNAVLIGSQAGYYNTAAGTVAIGYQAGDANTTGTGNTFLGYQSGSAATGSNNTMVGYDSGKLIVAGAGNTIVGTAAGDALNAASNNNTVVGFGALGSASAAVTDTTAIGYQAAYSNTAGGTTAIGYQAGYGVTASTGNTYVGYRSGYQATGINCTFSGYQSGRYTGSGASNSFYGYNAGVVVTTGSRNVAVGTSAYSGSDTVNSSSGTDNVAVGYRAGYSMADAHSENILVGSECGYSLIASNGIVGVGFQAAYSLTSGARMTAIGYKAGRGNVSGADNTYIGYNAGVSATGANNTIIGSGAGDAASFSGTDNVAIGYNAMTTATGAANYNTVIGSAAGGAITTGTDNTLIGYNAGSSITTGDYNIIIGPRTGASDSQRVFQVGYDSTNEPMFSGVMYDGVSGSGGTDSELQTNVQLFKIRDPENNLEQFRAKGGKLSTYGETDPDVEVGGLCLFVKPATSPNKNSLTFKLNKLTHGCTAFGETDTFAQYGRISDTTGSLSISGISTDGTATNDGARGIYMYSVAAAADVVGTPSKIGSTSSRGVFEINTAKINGASVASWAGDDIIFAVRNNTATQFLVTGSGSIQGNSAFIEYDDEDDIKLVQSFSNRKANPYYARLNDLGVISKDGMCDMQKMDMLSIGAIGQLFNVIRGLAKRLGVSEDELYELAKQY